MLTDLYLQKETHPPEEEHYYTELALRLIGSTEVSVRAAVAERLARYPAAPREVVMRLARDVIEIAEPFLKHSSCLMPNELAAIAAECGPVHAAIIEARDPGVRSFCGNAACGEDAPDDAQAAELTDLFFSADPAERRLILLNLDYAAVGAFEAAARQSETITRRLESAALAHNVDAFAQELELAFGISARLARRIVQDESGEPIMVAAKALLAPRAVLERILLFVNPQIGQSVQRVYELATCFDEISRESASRLVSIWHHAEPRQRAPAPSSRHDRSPRPLSAGGRSASVPFARRVSSERKARLRGPAGDG